MDHETAIRLLNEDMAGEHGAIILYLRIAYALRGSEVSASIEGIARDEMRHYRWLAEEIVRLGGVPTLERQEMPAVGDDPLALMQASVARETGAVQTYEAHAQAIGDPRTAALLRRIALDEGEHDLKFRRYIELLQEGIGLPAEEPALEEGPTVTTEPPQSLPASDVDALQENVSVEYTTLLQYLHQSFLTPSCPLSRHLDDQSIIEMKHMGWLAEFLADAGVVPQLDHGPVDVDPDPATLLRTDIAVEQAVEEIYQRNLGATEDPKLRALLQRILDHSVYHEVLFQYLLADVESSASSGEESPTPPLPGPPQSGWTVGSLLGRKQD